MLPLLWWAVSVRAQEPQEMAMPEQWQLTLDMIKSKTQDLMIENNGLQVQYRQLYGELEKLQREVFDWQSKNELMALSLKQRHGRTDQQMRIDDLQGQIRIKKERLGALKVRKNTAPDMSGNNDLTQWRQQLEDESKQEVVLENELKDLQAGNNTQNLKEEDIIAQNKILEARLELLRAGQISPGSNYPEAQADYHVRMVDQLKGRKEELEAKISAYESRMEQLKESSLLSLSWTQKRKRLIHEMVVTDARNNQMREKIKVLHEDIDVLNQQIAMLEHRLNFVKVPAAK